MPALPLGPRSTTTEISAAAPTLAVLPVGACEQHGPHLPIGTDSVIAQWLAERVSHELDGIQLPTLAYGTSAEHRGYIGTISLRPSTLSSIIEDIADSCAAVGIPRLAIISGHGGNWILRPAVRDLNAHYTKITIGVVPEEVIWGSLLPDDLHAGQSETSIVMHLDGPAVGDLPPDYVPGTARSALDILPIRDITPDGVWGMPSRATSEQGKEILTAMAERTVAYLRASFAELAHRRESTL